MGYLEILSGKFCSWVQWCPYVSESTRISGERTEGPRVACHARLNHTCPITRLHFDCWSAHRESALHWAPGQWRKGRRANCSFRLVTHHSGRVEHISPHLLHWTALAGVAMAKTAAPDHHLMDSIVVFIKGIIWPPSKQSIPKGVEFGKVYPQVC